MNKIESTLLSVISKYQNMPLVIAYSGGVDSQVLLHALTQLKHVNEIKSSLIVCHVNHGLSDNAQAWQNHYLEFDQRMSCVRDVLTALSTS